MASMHAQQQAMTTASDVCRLDVFHAIADPTRRAILTRLAQAGGEERSAGELSASFAMTLSAVSQHLRVLREAGLVEVRKAGRERLYRLNADPLREVAEWARTYEGFWQDSLDRLGVYLKTEEERGRGETP